MHQMISVYTTSEEFNNEIIIGHFGFVFVETRSGKSQEYSDAIVFQNHRFQNNVFRPHENEKPAFSNSRDLKSVFEILRFSDGLVWTVGLTADKKTSFSISCDLKSVFKMLRFSDELV